MKWNGLKVMAALVFSAASLPAASQPVATPNVGGSAVSVTGGRGFGCPAGAGDWKLKLAGGKVYIPPSCMTPLQVADECTRLGMVYANGDCTELHQCPASMRMFVGYHNPDGMATLVLLTATPSVAMPDGNPWCQYAVTETGSSRDYQAAFDRKEGRLVSFYHEYEEYYGSGTYRIRHKRWVKSAHKRSKCSDYVQSLAWQPFDCGSIQIDWCTVLTMAGGPLRAYSGATSLRAGINPTQYRYPPADNTGGPGYISVTSNCTNEHQPSSIVYYAWENPGGA